jgi:hypothetical protein
MPGVSGDEKLSGPPMRAALAKEPGLVPSPALEGFAAPRSGRVLCAISLFLSFSEEETPTGNQGLATLPYAGPNRIRFNGCFSAVLQATAPRATGGP